MPYAYELRESVVDRLNKLSEFEHEVVLKKINRICENPYHYKPLRQPLAGHRRVHVNTCYVLTYTIDQSKQMVIVEDYEHHDKVYGR